MKERLLDLEPNVNFPARRSGDFTHNFASLKKKISPTLLCHQEEIERPTDLGSYGDWGVHTGFWQARESSLSLLVIKSPWDWGAGGAP